VNRHIITPGSDGGRDKLARAAGTLASIAIEGATDYFFGRPLDENPYVRRHATTAWSEWRYGWLEASSYEQMRGDEERRRWLCEPDCAA
jgi:hypothetical protein